MSHETTVALAGHVVIVLTLVVDRLFALYREGRRHRWQQEENRQMRAAVDAVATEVKNGKH